MTYFGSMKFQCKIYLTLLQHQFDSGPGRHVGVKGIVLFLNSQDEAPVELVGRYEGLPFGIDVVKH